MQGRLRSEKLTAVIETECAHCEVPIHLEVDSDLDYRVRSEGATPVVCTPFVNVAELTPSIIDGF